jgi:hypothetical protein
MGGEEVGMRQGALTGNAMHAARPGWPGPAGGTAEPPQSPAAGPCRCQPAQWTCTHCPAGLLQATDGSALVIGMLGSLGLVTLVYLLMGLGLVLSIPFAALRGSPDNFAALSGYAAALSYKGMGWATYLVAAGACVRGLPGTRGLDSPRLPHPRVPPGRPLLLWLHARWHACL